MVRTCWCDFVVWRNLEKIWTKIKLWICFQCDIWSRAKVWRIFLSSISPHSHPICESIAIAAKTIQFQRFSKARDSNCRSTMRISCNTRAIHPKRSRHTMTISERYSHLMWWTPAKGKTSKSIRSIRRAWALKPYTSTRCNWMCCVWISGNWFCSASASCCSFTRRNAVRRRCSTIWVAFSWEYSLRFWLWCISAANCFHE